MGHFSTKSLIPRWFALPRPHGEFTKRDVYISLAVGVKDFQNQDGSLHRRIHLGTSALFFCLDRIERERRDESEEQGNGIM
jgi:hypothetical protein